jgi:hypothetical protein
VLQYGIFEVGNCLIWVGELGIQRSHERNHTIGQQREEFRVGRERTPSKQQSITHDDIPVSTQRQPLNLRNRRKPSTKHVYENIILGISALDRKCLYWYGVWTRVATGTCRYLLVGTQHPRCITLCARSRDWRSRNWRMDSRTRRKRRSEGIHGNWEFYGAGVQNTNEHITNTLQRNHRLRIPRIQNTKSHVLGYRGCP